MIVFITYSNDLYAKTRDHCAKMALKKGKVDKAIVYKPEDIDKDFYQKNHNILDLRDGNGLWLWKPYFVCKTLDFVEDGDIVLYCDAGSFFFRSCKNIINRMEYEDIWVSDLPLIEKQFTKPELLERLDCTAKEYTETNQIQANFIAIRKTERGMAFAHEWLDTCTDGDNLLRDTRYNTISPVFPYLGHRCDQSVLSLLVKKWNIKIQPDPTQFYKCPELYDSPERIFEIPNHPEQNKPCIILHRTRNVDFVRVLRMWSIIWLPRPLLSLLLKYRKQKKQKKCC